MNIVRSGICVVVDRNFLYVIGGYVKDVILDVVEVFDLVRNFWNIIVLIFCRRMFVCVVVVKSKVFVFGGFGG